MITEAICDCKAMIEINLRREQLKGNLGESKK